MNNNSNNKLSVNDIKNKILRKKLHRILVTIGRYKMDCKTNIITRSYANNNSTIIDCYGEKFKNLIYNIGLTEEDYRTIIIADEKDINIGYIAATHIKKFVKNNTKNINILYNILSSKSHSITTNDIYQELFSYLLNEVKLNLITSAADNRVISLNTTNTIIIGKILNKDISKTKTLLENLGLEKKFNKILVLIKNKDETTTNRLTALLKILIFKRFSTTVNEFINIMLESNYSKEECDKFINKIIKKIPNETDSYSQI